MVSNIFRIFAPFFKMTNEMEYSTTIIGRRHEQDLIREYYESPKAELVAVYGRRRVGKTFLVRECFNGQFDFSFTGLFETPRSTHL